MDRKIEAIDGIGPAYAGRLRTAGILQTNHLLEKGRTAQDRRTLAQQCGVDEAQLRKWVAMCDLSRIKGVGGQYAELLEAAGVTTVKKMANRTAISLMDGMRTANAEQRRVRQIPNEKSVSDWIAQARQLESAILE